MANDVSNGNAASKANKITVVLGAQWGDEGKGKLVDLVAKDFDVIARCQVRVASTFWGVRSVVMFCKAFLKCSTCCWADTAAFVQPSW